MGERTYEVVLQSDDVTAVESVWVDGVAAGSALHDAPRERTGDGLSGMHYMVSKSPG